MQDMTCGSPSRALIRFCLPLLAGNLLQQFYNMVDASVVGRFVGPDALAAVSSSFAVLLFLYSILIGLCMGAGVFFSRLYGARDLDLSAALSTALIALMALVVALMGISLIFLNAFLTLYRVPPEIIPACRSYLRIVIAGMGFVLVYNWSACVLRALGDSRTPLYFLLISTIVNIALDLIFVLLLHLGVAGVALATIIAQAVSAVAGFFFTVRALRRADIPLKPRFHRGLLGPIVRYSLLTSIQQSVMNLGGLLVQGLVNTFGISVMAAFAAGAKVDAFAHMPAQEFGNTLATFSAQNKGAGHMDRVRRGFKISILFVAGFFLIVSPLCFLFARPLISLFIDPSQREVLEMGVHYLHVVAPFYALIGLLSLYYGFYRGCAAPSYSILLTIVSLGTRVLLANLLARTAMGYEGIWWAIPIGWTLADIAGTALYRSRVWERAR